MRSKRINRKLNEDLSIKRKNYLQKKETQLQYLENVVYFKTIFEMMKSFLNDCDHLLTISILKRILNLKEGKIFNHLG